MSQQKIMLGYDIGGTKIAISLGSEDGKILAKERIDNVDTYPEDILPQLVSTAQQMMKNADLKSTDIAAFGISAPYPADPINGIMTAPSNNKHWHNVPILQYLKDNLQMEGYFENDANCGALAEWFFGAGRGCTDMIYLTMSTGIGGGIIAAGHLVRGNNKSLSAGELGHICIQLDGRQCNCGMKGCYEAYSGGRALAQRMQEKLKDKPDSMIMQLVNGKVEDIDMVVLEKAVRAGDAYALALWDEMSRRSAQAFGLYINIFNPQKLVLGTLAWAVGDLYTDPIKKYLPQFCWKEPLAACEIVNSELRRDIGYYAGIAAALNNLQEQQR